jgi:hypothetical protein
MLAEDCVGATPGSILRFPMLMTSSFSLDCFDCEPIEVGLNRVFGEGDFGGAVSGERPDGGFDVRTTGGIAASSGCKK